MIIGSQAARTSSSATALRVTSGPTPAGSPIVTPMRGFVLATIELVPVFAAIHLGMRPRKLVVIPVTLIFIHILNIMFENEQVRAFITVQLDAVLIVPFDCPAQFLVIPQYKHHRRVRVHLLLIIEAFRV